MQLIFKSLSFLSLLQYIYVCVCYLFAFITCVVICLFFLFMPFDRTVLGCCGRDVQGGRDAELQVRGM